MTKVEIVEYIIKRNGDLTMKQAAQLLEEALDLIKQTLAHGENVKISGFGHFTIRDKNGRIGRNPKSGERITLKARRVVTFKASPLLRDRVNQREEQLRNSPGKL